MGLASTKLNDTPLSMSTSNSSDLGDDRNIGSPSTKDESYFLISANNLISATSSTMVTEDKEVQVNLVGLDIAIMSDLLKQEQIMKGMKQCRRVLMLNIIKILKIISFLLLQASFNRF